MEFSMIFMISFSVLILCSSLAYGQVAMSTSPTPSPSPAPAPTPAYKNLKDLLSVAGPYHKFLDYLESTKLIDTFQIQANNTVEGITIFVPKDNAFKALKKPSLSNLTDDQLKSVLLFHALPRYYALADFNDLSERGPISTLAGGQYTLQFNDDSGTVRLDSGWSKAKVTSAVHTSKPVAVYQVDKVLLPEAIFGTDIPPTPAPAPALGISPSADTPSAAEVAEPQVTSLCMEAQECMVMGRWLDLASLMLTSAELVFPKVSDKDLECIFTVICNLASKLENPDDELEMAKLISTKISQQPNDKPAMRLKILFNLYNLLEGPDSRFFVYMQALNLALNGKVIDHIVPSFKKIDSFLKEWNIGVKDQRNLFLTIANVLKENKSSGKDSFKFLTKYLETFSGEDSYVIGEAKEEAVRAVIEFVKAPDTFRCDLLDMPAVGQLEKDAKYALVYQLLKIFLTQRLDAYLEFQAANSTLMKSYGLVHEDCITKMRLMSLVDLGSYESGQIPYALIKDTLRINDDEVELWIVKAITAKLIDCKMDQMNQVVIVSRCTERIFGQHQWHSLRLKLATWRGNVASLISTIQANKAVEEGSQAMQGMAIR